MAIPLRKIIHRGVGLLGLSQPSVSDVASHIEVLCPAEVNHVLPVIYNPDELQRVTKCENTTTMEVELQRLTRDNVAWAATKAFHIENVVLEDGSLYCKGWRARISQRPLPWPGGKPVDVESGALGGTYLGSYQFGHWVHDDLTMILEAERYAMPIHAARPPYKDEAYYNSCLGTYSKPVIRARFEKFILFDDVGQNSSKRRRYNELRSRFRKKHPHNGAERVFIHRGTSGVMRKLVNETALEEILTREGFMVVDPEKQSAEEITKTCAGARIVAGVDGAQLAHGLIAMDQRGGLIALMPPNRFLNGFRDLCDGFGLRYGMIVGSLSEDGFAVNADELLRLIDNFEKALSLNVL